ncbi:hypothetical protein [Brachybacterium hainanense]|uniref:Uncharacterized protein n=1 Tax=Brachybacterium hainanense TaxID=1541174 RepID=A0ABV6R6A6_9MICO
MNTTSTITEDRTAADPTPAPIVYRPFHAAWGDAAELAELRRLRAERRRTDDLALEQARAARRAEAADRPAREGRARTGRGHHRGHGLRLFGHRFA